MRLLTIAVAGLALSALATPARPAAVAPCRAAVDRGVIPPWARTGFSDPRPRMPHVLGRKGEIVALLFAYPLRAPRPTDHNNKILWVARRLFAPTRLAISAQRMVGGRPVGKPVARSVMGGPGPSIIDMPTPGCWRFTLRWAHRADTLDLVYR